MRQLLALLIIILLTSCGGSRKHLEGASAYEREGMMQEAYERYSSVHRRKPGLVEAHIGMKRTAQHVFDRIQQNASMHYLATDLQAGDRARQEALSYRASVERRGLLLEWDPLLEARRREAVTQLAQQHFLQAEAACKAGNFELAEQLAARTLALDPQHQQAHQLRKVAQLEPGYLKALQAMELRLWRDAYKRLGSITERDPSYKDAWTLMEECRSHASYTLAYVPLVNMNGIVTVDMLLGGQSVDHQLAGSIKRHLLGLNDPMLLLVDREDLDKLLTEQRRNMSGKYDDRYVAEAGKLMGARYVLTGKVLRFDDVIGRHMDVQMQLVETATGRILIADVIRVDRQDLARGKTRTQLLEMAGERVAGRLKDFDPVAR